MPVLQRTEMSCGMQVMYNLYDVNEGWLKDHLKARYKFWSQRNHAAVADGKIYKGETIVFSDAVRNDNGIRLVRLIRKHKLGRVVSLRTENPNSKNQITTYLWCYNGKQLPK